MNLHGPPDLIMCQSGADPQKLSWGAKPRLKALQRARALSPRVGAICPSLGGGGGPSGPPCGSAPGQYPVHDKFDANAQTKVYSRHPIKRVKLLLVTREERTLRSLIIDLSVCYPP